MTRFLLKIFLSALIIAAVSEAGKRSSLVAAIVASLPLTSILAMSWLYWDTGDSSRVISLSNGIFWAVLPSLLFFVLLPVFLKAGVKFPLAMIASCGAMAVAYSIYVLVLRKFGVSL